MPADIHGILLLDKPLGLSSAGAVARAKHLFNARKAGHTGSLDPLASGLLPICFVKPRNSARNCWTRTKPIV
jgi:tRNA pseudouridine55 synthase